MDIIEFKDLESSDLNRDVLCKGGTAENISSEPISKIFPVGNQSGVRIKGTFEKPTIVVLYSTFSDPDWPDSLNNELLIYYGDNKIPGKEIHDTQGNKVLRTIFNLLHLNRTQIPPIFLFQKANVGYDRIFNRVSPRSRKQMNRVFYIICITVRKIPGPFNNSPAIRICIIKKVNTI